MNSKPAADRADELEWFKSSYSNNDEPECVEVATAPGTVHVRDSKDPDGPQLAFNPAEWSVFIAHMTERG